MYSRMLSLAEQFIGQELLAGIQPHISPQLFYWSREEKNSNAEIDYIFQHKNNIYPIEVKSGKTGTLKSLQLYLIKKSNHPNLSDDMLGWF